MQQFYLVLYTPKWSLTFGQYLTKEECEAAAKTVPWDVRTIVLPAPIARAG